MIYTPLRYGLLRDIVDFRQAGASHYATPFSAIRYVVSPRQAGRHISPADNDTATATPYATL